MFRKQERKINFEEIGWVDKIFRTNQISVIEKHR